MKKLCLINEIHDSFGHDGLEIIEQTSPSSSNRYIKLRTILQTLDELNKNRRIYPKTLYEYALRSLQEDINTIVGELDHPLLTGNSEADALRHFIVLYRKASHKFSEIVIEGNNVVGNVETLFTTSGSDMAGIIMSGIPVGFSVRAVGQTRPLGEGKTEITAPFNIITWDCVSNPSHASARMTNIVQENTGILKENVDGFFKNDEILYERYDILNEMFGNVSEAKTDVDKLDELVRSIDSKIRKGQTENSSVYKEVNKMGEMYLTSPTDEKLDIALIDFLEDYITGKTPLEKAFNKAFGNLKNSKYI